METVRIDDTKFVEVHVSTGLPGFTIAGVPDLLCRQIRDRVRAAFLSSGLAWPMYRITVNAVCEGISPPASFSSRTTPVGQWSNDGYDLAIAIGILAQAPAPPEWIVGLAVQVHPDCAEAYRYSAGLGMNGTINPRGPWFTPKPNLRQLVEFLKQPDTIESAKEVIGR